MPTAPKMEEQPSLPNVSIPCHNEQRDKKKRYTVRAKTLIIVQFAINHIGIWYYLCLHGLSLPFFQVYKVIVNVGQQEWFVFRRYAEFDKLYNTVSPGTMPFWIYTVMIPKTLP